MPSSEQKLDDNGGQENEKEKRGKESGPVWEFGIQFVL